ncbi:MAG: ArnT family glycosyltransferase, partial [Stellaceae bacterium]
MIEQWCRGVRPYILLGLLSLALDLPGIAALPVLDRDEARFAQATRQMLETGDFLRIRFQDEARNKKPAGIYWLQAVSVAAFSNAESGAIWPYRVPSLLGGVAAVLLAFGLGQGLVGRPAALIGAGLLAATLELSVEAHIAKTDAALLAAAVAAQGALGLIYRAARENRAVPWRWPLLFWLAHAAAILLKGPVIALLSILTVAALSVADRDSRWLKGLRAWWGVPLLILVVGPWLYAIERATQGQFLSQSVGGDLFAKLIGGEEAHGAPPLTHLLILMAGFWPATIFLGNVIAHGWRERRDGATRFLIAWAVPFWILVELVPTKLPQYLLPVYPALALAAGAAILAGDGKWRRYDLLFGAIGALVALCLMALMVEGPIRYGGGLDFFGVAAAIGLAALAGLLVFRRQTSMAPRLAICCSLVVFIPLGQFVAPRLDQLFVSRQAAALIAQKPVAVVGYSEPS